MTHYTTEEIADHLSTTPVSDWLKGEWLKIECITCKHSSGSHAFNEKIGIEGWSHCGQTYCTCKKFKSVNDLDNYLEPGSYERMTKEKMDEKTMELAVEKWRKFFGAKKPPAIALQLTPEQMVTLETLFYDNSKIYAIKFVRQTIVDEYGKSLYGLQEAKSLVDEYWDWMKRPEFET